ncbi:hypothetical protein HYH02_006251 [Chlamydomonas schloesseri]|uniref:Uncharacterized protein n=1 Tax=Chlamydomonas schloesseri TaxID=2026947 RepID=A0A835WJN6_9CHLO|nr:hypothetical protein HYH02_006251 [Chlamydomonas schloesseri]|eukprot:KAG2448903.1 hypothetical protein HYH02_006251 [Chlamydomonas schloesseri]
MGLIGAAEFAITVALFALSREKLQNKDVLVNAIGIPVDVQGPNTKYVNYECLWHPDPSQNTACYRNMVAFAFTIGGSGGMAIVLACLLFCMAGPKAMEMKTIADMYRGIGPPAVIITFLSWSVQVVSLALWVWTADTYSDWYGTANAFGLPQSGTREDMRGLAWANVGLFATSATMGFMDMCHFCMALKEAAQGRGGSLENKFGESAAEMEAK